MQKTTALALLGGTVTTAAKRLGCSYQAVSSWPDVLPRRIADRVLAARVRLEWEVALESAKPGSLELSPVIADALTV